MTEKACKWCKDEFCVNDQCPMCADYCPTAQYPGVCKYEELIDVEYRLTPKGCLATALSESGIDIANINLDKIFNTFEKLMVREGNIEVVNNDVDKEKDIKEPVEFKVGAKVTLDDITGSGEWELDSFNGRCATYVTKDHALAITFVSSSSTEIATIYKNL